MAKSKGNFPAFIVIDFLRISYFKRALGLVRYWHTEVNSCLGT